LTMLSTVTIGLTSEVEHTAGKATCMPNFFDWTDVHPPVYVLSKTLLTSLISATKQVVVETTKKLLGRCHIDNVFC